MKNLAILLVLIWTHNSMAMGGLGSIGSVDLSGMDLVGKKITSKSTSKKGQPSKRKIASQKKRPQNIWKQEKSTGWFN